MRRTEALEVPLNLARGPNAFRRERNLEVPKTLKRGIGLGCHLKAPSAKAGGVFFCACCGPCRCVRGAQV